ncbi:MAG: transcriptional regulator NrdR [Clostridiales bacterium]|nr:transcriptional regulator NrdR [Clostridiales bacterium]
MRCPYCGNEDTKVIDSRPSEDRAEIRRRRVCEKCERRFTTYERIETVPLMVIKRDNAREVFDRDKLIRNIMRACHKRPVTSADIEQIADDIENLARSSYDKEIRTTEIGELVLQRLQVLDQVAYVRFASVYRDFTDIDSFLKVLTQLKAKEQ